MFGVIAAQYGLPQLILAGISSDLPGSGDIDSDAPGAADQYVAPAQVTNDDINQVTARGEALLIGVPRLIDRCASLYLGALQPDLRLDERHQIEESLQHARQQLMGLAAHNEVVSQSPVQWFDFDPSQFQEPLVILDRVLSVLEPQTLRSLVQQRRNSPIPMWLIDAADAVDEDLAQLFRNKLWKTTFAGSQAERDLAAYLAYSESDPPPE